MRMETITTIATAVPPYPMTCAAVKQAVQQVFQFEPRRRATVMALFDHAQVARRYSVFPLDYLMHPRSLTQTAREYQEYAVALGRQVALDCLAQAGVPPVDIDLLITVSCTGYMIPSLDAYLINDLGFRANVRRLPITELGCAAGAVALARAREFVRAFPGSCVLVVAVELPSLTFQPHDRSQANMISCALFGDGAAAALVMGRAVPGVRILDTESYLFPDTLDAMGFDLKDNGLHIVLSKDVPDLVRSRIKRLVGQFLGRHGLAPEQLSACILHPGGKKLLGYLEEELDLSRDAIQPSWDVLQNYGNLSSAAILFVLGEWLTKRCPAAGAYGLLAAFGPGFSAELLLLRWT
jgi:alkylresorcinol/alkylpyrone synthase